MGPWSLIALGIGAVIGAGLFSITGGAAANNAGPAIMISFVVAGIGCAFAGLCYAEFASMIPIAGSAYTYSYATMGEFIAWIIGWDLVLEYAVGAATVEYQLEPLLWKIYGRTWRSHASRYDGRAMGWWYSEYSSCIHYSFNEFAFNTRNKRKCQGQCVHCSAKGLRRFDLYYPWLGLYS